MLSGGTWGQRKKERRGEEANQARLQFQAQPSLSLILRQLWNVLQAMCVCPKAREPGFVTADLKLSTSTWADARQVGSLPVQGKWLQGRSFRCKLLAARHQDLVGGSPRTSTGPSEDLDRARKSPFGYYELSFHSRHRHKHRHYSQGFPCICITL